VLYKNKHNRYDGGMNPNDTPQPSTSPPPVSDETRLQAIESEVVEERLSTPVQFPRPQSSPSPTVPDAAVSNYIPVSPVVSQPKKVSSKWVVIPIISILVLAVAVSGYFVWQTLHPAAGPPVVTGGSEPGPDDSAPSQ